MRLVTEKINDKNRLANKTLILIFFTLIVSSCNNGSKNPVDILPEIKVDSQAFWGTWLLSRIYDNKPNKNCNLALTQANENENSLAAVFEEDGNRMEGIIFLSAISGDTIASIKHPNSGLWHILKVVFENKESSMLIYSLNNSELKLAFQGSLLEGENFEIGGKDVLRITDKGSKIRSYISNNVNAFDNNPSFVFQKSSL